MAELVPYLNQRILAVTNDGRVLMGTLKGFDQQTNLILEQTLERVFTRNGQEATGNQEEQAPEEEMGSSQLVPLGLYLVRGDNIALVGSMNEELEDQIDWTQVYADPLPALRV